jgi:hypothetical protein
MLKIYVKVNPYGEWKFLGEVKTQAEANRVYANAAARGYYCKIEE